MPHQVCNTAQLTCTMGSTPSALVVLPNHRLMTSSQPAANITDHQSLLNIHPFGRCRSQKNPVVADATDRALGRLTPMPCIPNTPVPWVSGAIAMRLDHEPSLGQGCSLSCLWAGVITVVAPGQATHHIG